jgi:hypothetical protein
MLALFWLGRSTRTAYRRHEGQQTRDEAADGTGQTDTKTVVPFRTTMAQTHDGHHGGAFLGAIT